MRWGLRAGLVLAVAAGPCPQTRPRRGRGGNVRPSQPSIPRLSAACNGLSKKRSAASRKR